MANELPLDLRFSLDQLVEQAGQYGYDRADLITYLKNPSAPPASGRQRGRPRKDKNSFELACRVAARMVNGESIWCATKAIAREVSGQDTAPESVAKRSRRRLKQPPEIQSYFDLAAHDLAWAALFLRATNELYGPDSEPGREAYRQVGVAIEALQKQDHARGREIQRGADFRRLADEQREKHKVALRLVGKAGFVDVLLLS